MKSDRKQAWLLWCLGAALFAHVIAYFGIGYFDQMQFAWFALLASISTAVSEAARIFQRRGDLLFSGALQSSEAPLPQGESQLAY